MKWLLALLSLGFAHTMWSATPPFDFDALNFPHAEVIDENTARIPFDLVDHLIVVEAALLGKKGKFIIDTGSETLILNSVHFPISTHQGRSDRAGVLQTVENVKQRRLRDFMLKNFSTGRTTSDVIDLSHIEKQKKIHLLGIIGHNVLKDYEIFIDMYLNQITLSRIDPKGNKLDPRGYLETIVDSIPFRSNNHTIILDAFVDKEPVRFGLDTGAEINQLNKGLNKKVLRFFSASKKVSLIGASGEKNKVLAGNLFRVKLTDSIFFGPMFTLVTNLDKMNQAFGTQLDGILGYEFFAQKRTIINYKKEMLYFIDYPKAQNYENPPPD